MAELLSAFGLVLVLEGALWTLFPDQMKRAAASAVAAPERALRFAGLAFAALGVVLVWFVRG